MRPDLSKAPGVLRTRAGALDPKPLLTLQPGFYLYGRRTGSLSQFVGTCLSCGRRLRLTGATVTVRGVCGHLAVCKVCRGCVEQRGLIG